MRNQYADALSIKRTIKIGLSDGPMVGIGHMFLVLTEETIVNGTAQRIEYHLNFKPDEDTIGARIFKNLSEASKDGIEGQLPTMVMAGLISAKRMVWTKGRLLNPQEAEEFLKQSDAKFVEFNVADKDAEHFQALVQQVKDLHDNPPSYSVFGPWLSRLLPTDMTPHHCGSLVEDVLIRVEQAPPQKMLPNAASLGWLMAAGSKLRAVVTSFFTLVSSQAVSAHRWNPSDSFAHFHELRKQTPVFPFNHNLAPAAPRAQRMRVPAENINSYTFMGRINPLPLADDSSRFNFDFSDQSSGM